MIQYTQKDFIKKKRLSLMRQNFLANATAGITAVFMMGRMDSTMDSEQGGTI